MHRKVTFEIRDRIIDLDAQGWKSREIGAEVGLHYSTVCTLLRTDFANMGKFACKGCGNPTSSELKYCAAKGCQKLYKQEYYSDRRRNYYLKTTHGITEQEFDEMYDAQDGRCAICSIDITKRQARMDHDHDTGKLRKLLCHHCNIGLGHFFDNPATLHAAIEYLEACAK